MNEEYHDTNQPSIQHYVQAPPPNNNFFKIAVGVIIILCIVVAIILLTNKSNSSDSSSNSSSGVNTSSAELTTTDKETICINNGYKSCDHKDEMEEKCKSLGVDSCSKMLSEHNKSGDVCYGVSDFDTCYNLVTMENKCKDLGFGSCSKMLSEHNVTGGICDGVTDFDTCAENYCVSKGYTDCATMLGNSVTDSNTVTAYDSYESPNYFISELKNSSFGVNANDDGKINYSFKGTELNVCSDASTCGGIKTSNNTLSLGQINAQQLCFGDTCIDMTQLNVPVSTTMNGSVVRTLSGSVTDITFDSTTISTSTDDIMVDLTDFNLLEYTDTTNNIYIISRILLNPGSELRSINAGGIILWSLRNTTNRPIVLLNSDVYGTEISSSITLDTNINTEDIYFAQFSTKIIASKY